MDILFSQILPVQGISPDKIELILSDTEHRIKKFKTGSMICQSGEPVIH